MAQRPIFCPNFECLSFVREHIIEFTWYAGFAKSQAQKSIRSLHEGAAALGVKPVLDISSKSLEPLGVHLSAFNLMLTCEPYGQISVESAFQGSKVFVGGRQFIDIYKLPSRDAKTDPRIRGSGDLESFNYLGERWPLDPKTAFYDWLYIKALSQNPELSSRLRDYMGFSDIAFNPARSFNCQARAAAVFVALERCGLLGRALSGRDAYLALLRGEYDEAPEAPPAQAHEQSSFL